MGALSCVVMFARPSQVSFPFAKLTPRYNTFNDQNCMSWEHITTSWISLNQEKYYRRHESGCWAVLSSNQGGGGVAASMQSPSCTSTVSSITVWLTRAVNAECAVLMCCYSTCIKHWACWAWPLLSYARPSPRSLWQWLHLWVSCMQEFSTIWLMASHAKDTCSINAISACLPYGHWWRSMPVPRLTGKWTDSCTTYKPY